jgi:hypothetical protein
MSSAEAEKDAFEFVLEEHYAGNRSIALHGTGGSWG